MRRREIQNFTLKLSDLKEYEVAKQERVVRTSDESSSGAADLDPMKTPEVTVTPLPKVGGAKTKQEIRARIGFPLELP